MDFLPYKPRTPLKELAVQTLTKVGAAIQPFAAPQQILFGGIGAIEDLVTGKGAAAAAATFARGLGAAGDYLTYGATANPAFAKFGIGDGKDGRATRISGFELAKKAGLPDYLAKPVGIAADFLVDVPLLGYLGKVSGVGRYLGVSTGINRLASENMALNFLKTGGVASNPADWDIAGMARFAARVAASPVSTAPIHDIVNAIPKGMREQIAQKAAGMIEAARIAPVRGGIQPTESSPLGKTVGQYVVNRFGAIRGLPTMDGRAFADLRLGKLTGTGIAKKVEGFIYNSQIETANMTLKANQASSSYVNLTARFAPDAKAEFDNIARRMLDWGDIKQYTQAKIDLAAFSARIGDAGFTNLAMRQLHDTAALEAYGGLLRHRDGTMGIEKAAGYYDGLRKYERDTFGAARTANPLGPDLQLINQQLRNSGRAPLKVPIAMHLRRVYNIASDPYTTILKVQQAALPSAIMHIDDAQLGETMFSWMRKNSPTANAPMQNTVAIQMAQDFKAFYTNRAQNEPQAMTQFMQTQGYTPTETLDFVKHIGKEWHQNGITYRPPYEDVVQMLRKLSANPTKANITDAGSSPALGLSNGPLSSRANNPEWLRESMGQVDDISRLLDENIRIGMKQQMNRSIVQTTYDFLQAEGGILKASEVRNLPGGTAHQNWRYIDTSMAERLKAANDHQVLGRMNDTPFTPDTYIPAAYHDLLNTFSTVEDTGVKWVMLQMLNTSFKAHKVANPGAILRDVASNFRFADDMGINPFALTKSLAQALELRKRAIRGGGAFDLNAQITVNGTDVKWSDILEHGGFVHGNFLNNEIQGSYEAIRQNFAAKGATSPMQRVAAAFIDHADRTQRIREAAVISGDAAAKAGNAARTGVAGVVDLATGLGGPITQKLMDVKGEIDTLFKMAVYINKRGQGMNGAKAAQHADEMFFNYMNQPVAVDWLRKNGVSPFAAFQFMASGRFIRTMYENPYAVEKFYRLPQSLSDGDTFAQGEMANTSPQYMQQNLWIPMPSIRTGKMVRDSNKRLMMFNLASVMPESSLFDFVSGDAISNWIPPYVATMSSIITGQGYGGAPLYAGGKTLAETIGSGKVGQLDAARGVVKALHQYGATPWAPGSPMADRMAKSIVDSLIPAERVAHNPMVQAYMKTAQEGVFAAPLSRYPIVAQGIGQQAPQDFGVKIRDGKTQWTAPYTPMRYFGITGAPVTGIMAEPGSSLSGVRGLAKQIKDLRYQMQVKIKAAGGDAKAIDQIVGDMLPTIFQIQSQLDVATEFDKYAQDNYNKTMAKPTPEISKDYNPFK